MSDLTPRLQSYRLRGACPIVTTAGFGDMAFQHVPGKGFDLWYSTYAITTPATLTGRADIPVLELHIPFRNRMLTRWDGIGELAMDERQFDLSFTPHVLTEVNFTQTGNTTPSTCIITKTFSNPSLRISAARPVSGGLEGRARRVSSEPSSS